MMFKKQRHLLTQREEAGAFRFLKQSEGLIDFCSNDYLGLAKEGSVFKGKHVIGSGGSRLLSGNYPEVERLECFLAEFHQSESALVFNSGYNANVGLFSAVPQKGDTIFYDELIHASIKEGMRLSYAKTYSFKHNDIINLKNKLKHAEGDVYVAVESVYSMDGDSAPLESLTNFCAENNLILIVDEAHAVGVFGNKGEGYVQSLGLEERIPIRIVTFGKAIGAHGAAVLSNSLIKDFLVNFSRSFIYTTALPPSSIKAIEGSYSTIRKENINQVLFEKIRLFKNQFSDFESDIIISSNSPIQCILFPGNKVVKEVSCFLVDAGFDVRPVMSPTVKKGKERIRVCLHVFNTDDEIINLANAIKVQIAKARN